MTAYNINNVARLMNEDAAKYNRETREFEKNEEHMPGGHNAPPIANNAQPVKYERNAKGKIVKTSDGSGKGKEKAKGNPFAKKGGKKSNPFAKKGDKDGKKENPFAKKGQVEESIDRLLHLLEVLDPASLRSKNKAYQQAPRKPGAQKLTVGHDPEPYVDGKPKPRAWSLPDGMMIWQNQRALRRKGSGFQQDKGPVKKNIGTKDPYAAISAKTAAGRGYGATSSANRAFQDAENNRLQPYLDGLVRVADEIQNPGFSPKNTKKLMQKLEFL